METSSTNTGISVLGKMAWGTHACYFYETQQDLLSTVVPYFQAGLENKEFCLWVVSKSEPLTIAEAKSALREATPDLDRHLAEGSIEIVDYDEWFYPGGELNIYKVIGQFREKLNQALAKGYAGMRVNGSSAWLLPKHRGEFLEFEDELDRLIARQRMVVLCTFPLVSSGAADILDAARVHQLAIALRHGKWEILENPERVQAREELKASSRKALGELHLERLTPRQREVLALTARGFAMKEVALTLNISVKTVETHRSNLMARLDLHDVPSLVRHAIKAGLINVED
jgi:DNA-binding CsgD family transcriptional regulator